MPASTNPDSSNTPNTNDGINRARDKGRIKYLASSLVQFVHEFELSEYIELFDASTLDFPVLALLRPIFVVFQIIRSQSSTRGGHGEGREEK